MAEHERQHPNLTLGILALGAMAYALLQSAVIPALPELQKSLNASETGIAWVLTAYLLSASVATPVLGRLGDMFGKERLLLSTYVILAAGTLMAALVNTLPLLIVARVIQGAGGGIFPLAFGIIRDEFPREKVAGAIGFLSAILGIGAAAGIVLGGLIVEHLSWHWLFWIPLVALVGAVVLTARFVPESPVRVPGRINWLSGLLMAVGLSAVLLAISEATTWGWGSAKTIGLLLGGLGVCAAWVFAELRAKEPLVDMGMMRLRGVWTTNLAGFLLGGGMYASFVLIPQFVEEPKSTGYGFGASVLAGGIFLLPSAATMLLTGALAGRVAGRFGSSWRSSSGRRSALRRSSCSRSRTASPGTSTSRRPAGAGIGLAFAAMGNLIVVAVPARADGSGFGNEHSDAHDRRRGRQPGRGHADRGPPRDGRPPRRARLRACVPPLARVPGGLHPGLAPGSGAASRPRSAAGSGGGGRLSAASGRR